MRPSKYCPLFLPWIGTNRGESEDVCLDKEKRTIKPCDNCIGKQKDTTPPQKNTSDIA